MSAPATTKRIFLIAGEPSGDLLGAKLMRALKAQAAEPVTFYGIGGPQMQAEGLETLFPMSELAIIGFAEIIPYIPALLGRLKQTEAEIRRLQPDIVVTIDSPGFNFRIAKRLQGAGITLLHFVAPTVWAYRPERAKKVAELYDHIMVLLPFEPPYFKDAGIECTFVGHPVVEGWQEHGDGKAYRRKHNIPLDAPTLCISPGSRRGEVARHLPIFSEAVRLLHKRYPNLHAIVPTVPSVHEAIADEVASWPVPTVLMDVVADKKDAFNACDLALAKSGTVTLELALADVPTVVTYRVNPISAWMMRRMILVRFVNLINIISGKEVVPELLQEFCKPNLLADAVDRLLKNPEECQEQIAEAREALQALGLNDVPPPSHKAAEVVMRLAGIAAKAEAVQQHRQPEAQAAATL